MGLRLAPECAWFLTGLHMNHYDTFGTVPAVERRLEVAIPRIFPENSENIMTVLKDNIEKYARQNGWEFVVVSVSRGLARMEMEQFLENEIHHSGCIVIDPTASTPEHKVFEAQDHARIQKDRLIRLNEQQGDVMAIIYGVSKLDKSIKVHFLMRRLRMAEGVLELMLRDIESRHLGQRPLKLAHSQLAKVKDIHQRLKHLGHGADSIGSIDNINETDPTLGLELFALMAMHNQLHEALDDVQLREALEARMLQLTDIPHDFEELGLNYNAALAAQQNYKEQTLRNDIVRLDQQEHKLLAQDAKLKKTINTKLKKAKRARVRRQRAFNPRDPNTPQPV